MMTHPLRLDALADGSIGPSPAGAPVPFRPRASVSARPTILADAVLLGMPHLCATGLAEGWLLKELGHRHWMTLAHAAGRSTPDFLDDRGEPVYAAFCALSMIGCDFGSVRENDTLAIATDIARLSRTQVSSQHELSIGGRPIGSVEMVSTFVRRVSGGSNHAVARVAVDGLPPQQAARSGLAQAAAKLRAGAFGSHLGFDLQSAGEVSSIVFDPCPSQDFNGAGFLYFTSFIAFVDRAEWTASRAAARLATTLRRDVFFRGNIDPGESLRVTILSLVETGTQLKHHCQLARGSDGAIIADVFSDRTIHR